MKKKIDRKVWVDSFKSNETELNLKNLKGDIMRNLGKTIGAIAIVITLAWVSYYVGNVGVNEIHNYQKKTNNQYDLLDK